MVGMSPPPPVDLAAARARGLPPPPWMQGPIAPSVSGSLPTPQAPLSSASGLMPTNLPASGASRPAPGFVPPMQFRPLSQPQSGHGFLPSSSPQFRSPSSIPPSISMHPPSMSGATTPSIPSNLNMQPPSVQGVGPPSIAPSMSVRQPAMPGVGPPVPQPQTTQYPQGLPTSQGFTFNQQQRPLSGVPTQAIQQSQPLNLPPPGAVRVTPPPSFTFAASAAYSHQNYGAIPAPISTSGTRPSAPWPMTRPWPSSQTTPSGAPQLGLTGQQNSLTVNSVLGPTGPVAPSFSLGSEWQEHVAPDGRRYYYNRMTKLSSWEKPLELMTPLERADASTIWKEFTTADGKKYYYNKLTKQSKWTLPEELKTAREQAEKVATPALAPVTAPVTEVIPVSAALSPSPAIITSPQAAPIASPQAAPIKSTASVPASPKLSSPIREEPVAVESTSPVVVEAIQAPLDVSSSDDKAAKIVKDETVVQPDPEQTSASKTVPAEVASDEASAQDIEEAKRAMPSAGKVNVTPLIEDKPVLATEEPVVYASKVEAKNAFEELLDAVGVESDWTWEQAMRLIINDKRYGALKNLGERKRTFYDFLAQKKKQEAEEKRTKQKKAREDFMAMMQESKELSSKMRWSKIVSLLGDDPRFRAIERDHEREELFEDYTLELEAKEKERAREERKKYIVEYRKFLESCDFIQANTQYRKVADRLLDDERCARLAKNDRLDVFQEYIGDLQKAEEEEMKTLKEQQRRRERKNRDDFRRLMEEHRASGLLNAHVPWRDYIVMVKDHPAYIGVCSNSSGTTPKELFEDVAEDMERQYLENKTRIKDTIKDGKINVTSEWTFDKFKAVLAEAGDVAGIPEPNLKFVFDDLLERAKEREEKEAKRKRRAVDDFNELLRADKSISMLTTWEDHKEVIETTVQFRAVEDEELCKKMFDDYVAHLQQKAKEKERKREEEKAKKEKGEKEKEKDKEKRKDKEKKERERDKDKSSRKEEPMEGNEVGNSHSEKEERKKSKDKTKDREKEKSKKHKRHHHSKSIDEMSVEKAEKDEGKRSHRHSGDKKRSSRKHGLEQDSDGEQRHKRHRKDRDRDGRNGRVNDLEDGELGEDGELS